MSIRRKVVDAISGIAEFFDVRGIYLSSGNVWSGKNGSGDVRIMNGTGEIRKARFLGNVTTLESCYWNAGDNISCLEVFVSLVSPTSAGDVAKSMFAMLAIDPANSTLASTWLSGADDLTAGLTEWVSADANFVVVPIGIPVSIPLGAILSQGAGGGGIVYARAADAATAINLSIVGS